MKSIAEQIEEIKEEMCNTRCKWLEKANKVDVKKPEDEERLQVMLEEICKECPLLRL